MPKKIVSLLLSLFLLQHCPGFSQASKYSNKALLRKLNADTGYVNLKRKITTEFAHVKPGAWGEFVKGVDAELMTSRKYIALTFDACGGLHSSGYDSSLIQYLRKEKVPATLFISGLWIDANYNTFLELSKDTLFEIENHGLNHKPCSFTGESIYGIQGTKNVSEAFDEIEANARKIKLITGRRPALYRSATAYIDEACTRMAYRLGISVIGYDVLSGDALAKTSIRQLVKNVLNNIKPGAVVIMHLNQPEGNTFECLEEIIPSLRKDGYTFTRLENFPLSERPH